MTFRTRSRIALLTILALLLIIAVGLLFPRRGAFEGSLFLPQGVAEHLVVALHDPGRSEALDIRAAAPEDLPFDNDTTAQRLPRGQHFDAIPLPFGLRFDRLDLVEERPAENVLVFHDRDGDVIKALTLGEDVELGGHPYTVESIGPWEGLIRHSGGQPMATIAMDTGSSTSPLFLISGTWVYPDGETALLFQWHDSEAEANEAVSSWALAEGAARWGVQEGTATQWLQSFVPGGTVNARDGSAVTLLEQSDDQGSIEVRKSRGDETTVYHIVANAPVGESDVIYENPLLASRRYILHAWGEDQALLQWRGKEIDNETHLLSAGEIWTDGGDRTIRLLQVMSETLPITQSDGRIVALHLSAEGRLYPLREGLIKTFHDQRVEFRQIPQRPLASYTLSVLGEDGQVLKEAVIKSDDTWHYGGWSIHVDAASPFSEDHVVMTVNQSGWGW